jgi:hypothetical protein
MQRILYRPWTTAWTNSQASTTVSFVEPAYSGIARVSRLSGRSSERGEREAEPVQMHATKSGEAVWVAGRLYNPVKDEVGRPFKVLIMLADEHHGSRKQAQVEVEQLIKAAAAGQLLERIATDSVRRARR